MEVYPPLLKTKDQNTNLPTLSMLLCVHCMSPGTDGHLVRVVDVGTAVATVTLAEAVVVHAVLLLLLLLTSVSNYGKAPLDCAACLKKTQTNHRYPQINIKQLVVTEEDKLCQD